MVASKYIYNFIRSKKPQHNINKICKKYINKYNATKKKENKKKTRT